MGDLEPAGWERELGTTRTIQSVDDLVPILKENFASGPVCLYISSNAVLVLHSYSSGKKDSTSKKSSLGRSAGRSVSLAVAASPSAFPGWLDSVHKSILSIVLRAYARLTRFGRDACILFSGESGAGKTVCCKACMCHLASFSPVCRGGGDDKRLGNLLLQIGPLLDAFGNAATARNDNSSRFGKCIGAVFDFRGHLVGAKVLHFMLERNRVSQRKVGERNFHIFYQLLKGAPGQLLRSLHLKSDVSNYQYISRSGGPSTAGSTDKADFAFVLEALKAIGLNEEQMLAIWHLIAAILHVGQLKFEKYAQEGATILNRPVLKVLSPLLGLRENDIEEFVCFKHGPDGEVRVQIEEAVRRRDVLAQALYDQIFLWLIQAINTILRPQPDEHDRIVTTPGYKETYRNINFVDLYGFAQQEASSFEQMCMNYSCEKVHQVFLSNTIKDRLQCFQEEGVATREIFFTDNLPVCDLFDDNNQGVFTLLDRATCDLPEEGSGDKAFLDLMDFNVAGHEAYTSRQVDPGDQVLCPFLDFRVRHFAGGVTYTIDGFVSSNRDIMTEAVGDLFLRSSNVIAKDIGIHQTRGEVTPNSTVGVNFRNAITTLADSIEHQDGYHVRCMKPNDTKAPKYFDEVKVRQQCDDLGLCEAIMVEQLGHIVQISYSDFCHRYRALSGRTRNFNGSVQDACRIILEDTVPSFKVCTTFGQSMVFFSSLDPMRVLNEKREALLEKTACHLARFWQKHRLRKCLTVIGERFRANSSSLEWPVPYAGTAKLISICQKAHRKWLYNRLLSTIPIALRPDMRLKTTGHALLGGKRRKWGHSRRWHGDYLSVNPAFRNRLKAVQKQAQFEKVIFSSAIRKVSKKLKIQDRCIVVTEKSIVFLDESFVLTKQPLPLEDVTEISVSSGHDQCMVICSSSGRRRDWLFSLQQPDVRDDFIGEITSIICQGVTRKFGVCPLVTIDQQVKANIGGEDIIVDIDYQFKAQPEFKKTGSHSLTLLWPA